MPDFGFLPLTLRRLEREAAEVADLIAQLGNLAEHRLKDEIARLRQIEARLQFIEGIDKPTYDIVLKSVAAQPYLSLREVLPNVDAALGIMRELVRVLPAKMESSTLGHFTTVVHSETLESNRLDIELGVVLTTPVEPSFRLAGDRALTLMKPYMQTFKDAVELFRPLSQSDLEVTAEGKEVLAWDTSVNVIETWKNKVANEPGAYMSEEKFLRIQDEIKDECKVKGKQLFQPIRVAVLGKPHGAELKQLVPLMNKTTLTARAATARAC